jgi:hypothetical protein
MFCGRYNKFGQDVAYSQYIPFTTLISNSMDEKGRQVNSISTEFKGHSRRVFRPSGWSVLCRGDLISAQHYSKDFTRLSRLLRKRIPHLIKMKLTTNYIKVVSGKSNTVGKMCLGIALIQPGFAEGFDSSFEDTELFATMPHLVFQDGIKMTNFIARAFRTDT